VRFFTKFALGLKGRRWVKPI